MQDDNNVSQNDANVDAYYGVSEAANDEVDLSFLDEDEK